MLASILGHPVEAASVPGGFYSRSVAQSAAASGIRMLFNSEPVTQVREAGGCKILGRFSLQRGDSMDLAAAFACGALVPRLQQWAFWNAKKSLKAAGGEAWLAVRKWFFARR